jgi:squalene-hopene/tetraprenyl-beta-curcumene cyclase
MMRTTLVAVLVLGISITALPTWAAGPDPKDVDALRDKAIDFLRKQQKEDGSYSDPRMAAGVTALTVAALLRSGLTPEDESVAKSLKYLEKLVKKDGGIYGKGLANYTTSVAIMALKDANKGGKYDTVLKNAASFLKKLQTDDPANKSIQIGGASYDGKGKPDLSNTHYFLEALLAAGVPKDDPAVKRAMKFIGRCQNHPGKEDGNDLPFALKARDEDKGGFVYRIDTDDEGHVVGGDGGLRSQGAMTYAGLKSFLYAGVDRKDPRVQAAVKWIARNYTLEENPGMKSAGLYYYYHTFAKAMDALGEDQFVTSDGKKHDWRLELFEALKKRQGEDGGFRNKGDKTFGEADPALATTFALLAASYCKK